MDLILKPTEACNFKCTFCSSTNIAEDSAQLLDLDYVARFLDRYPETGTIILNGGDPLMVKPEYYWKIIEMLDERKMDHTTLSFTTNLWAFYKKPEMWVELFKHPRVGVGTSFQYGNKRLKGDLKPFTEQEFWAISDKMLELVGYRPSFIAVIDESNEHTVLDTVRLAKAMGVVCKVNYAMASGPETTFKGIKIGNAGKTYVLADIYERYLEIYNEGLAEWEHNTQQMMIRLRGLRTICPQSRSCDSSIRTLQPGGSYYSCGSFGDDGLYPIDFEKEMAGGFVRPLEVQELHNLKHSCFSCPMFEICNGCRKTIHDLKHLGLVEHHCKKMKTLAPRIIDINGLTGSAVVTEYVDESKWE